MHTYVYPLVHECARHTHGLRARGPLQGDAKFSLLLLEAESSWHDLMNYLQHIPDEFHGALLIISLKRITAIPICVHTFPAIRYIHWINHTNNISLYLS